MELIADIFLVAGALGAGFYCYVLSRRLKRFTDLETGVGGAVTVLSSQAGELKKSLEDARSASDQSSETLQALTERAETVAQRLELMMASMHDVVPAEGSEPLAEPDAPEDVATTEAMATENPQDTPKSDVADVPDSNKSPGGLMFFRHARKIAGAGQ